LEGNNGTIPGKTHESNFCPRYGVIQRIDTTMASEDATAPH
jgi:hypothetical protein